MSTIYSYDAPTSKFCNYGWSVYTVNRKDGKFKSELEPFQKKNYVFTNENAITLPKMNTILTFRQDEALSRFFDTTSFIMHTGNFTAFIISATEDEYKIVFLNNDMVEKYEDF